MSIANLSRWHVYTGVAFAPSLQGTKRAVHASLICLAWASHDVFACPDLDPFYPVDNNWTNVRLQLETLLPECLESSEYFALLGAAQLNTGLVPAAMESLERALLLDPGNGAAQVDYSQALHAAGQLFPALELNRMLMGRNDLPAGVLTMVRARAEAWESQTADKGLNLEIGAGYDNNLNGAPTRSNFTLTLSGEPISLPLRPEYRPVDGAYLNTRLAGFYQKRTPTRTHDLIFALRNRQSEYSDFELLQFDWRYGLSLPMRRHQWELTAGTSHLLYGGSPLYTVTEGRVRFRTRGEGCKPHYELAAQHQLYHGQNFMAGLETSATGGVGCRFGDDTQNLTADVGLLMNNALKYDRPGGDRDGWLLRLNWQVDIGGGALNSQFSYANLDDHSGYSDLLDNGARRHVNNRLLRLQYTREISPSLSLILNFTHQAQGSNMTPFQNDGAAGDIGFSLNL